jgi:hypothetical protein
MTGNTRALVMTRSSAIHGVGLFAARDLVEPQALIEYRGQIIGWDEAVARYESQSDSDHEGRGLTYFFDRGDGTVIDGARAGNAAQFINHGCDPNCEAVAHGMRIWVHTTVVIAAGTELLLDYALQVDDPDDPEVRELYTCHCNSAGCRRTMLAP